MEKKIIPGESGRHWTLVSRGDRGVGGTAVGSAPWNFVERRDRAERRTVYDRRQLIRFEDDRRVGMERRVGAEAWTFP